MNGSYYGSSSTGRIRKLNEDSYYYNSKFGIEGNLFIVCDGMGGHKAGEVASRYASKKVPEYFYKSKQPNISLKLKESVVKVNNEIYNESTRDTSKRGMGTTIVAAILVNKKVYVANVGDSRAYLLRDGRLNKLTKDHSWVEEKISSGELSPDKARGHPKKNVITRCLGYEPDVKVDIFIYDLSEGDRLLLCSDGLWDELNDNEIANILIEGNNVNNAVKKLIISANDRGGKDNVTCIVIDYGVYIKKYPPIVSSHTVKKRKAKKVVYALISLSIIFLLLGLAIGILGKKLSETGSSDELTTKNEDEAPKVTELKIQEVGGGLELQYKEKGSESFQDGGNLIKWYKIYWLKNGSPQAEFNDKVFVSSEKLKPDDEWDVRIELKVILKVYKVPRKKGSEPEEVSNNKSPLALTDNNCYDGDPSWSPDGSKIAFASDRDGAQEIYVMDYNGDNQVALTDNDSNDRYPCFSPDGSKIAFCSDSDGDFEIYVMDLDGSNVVQLTDNDLDDWDPCFSPDGSKIAFSSDRDGAQEIYVMDLDGSNVVQLTDNDSNDWDPCFSPDGSKIAFASDRDGAQEIYVMDYNGDNQVALTDNNCYDGDPSWSPDGSKIAFASDRDGAQEIYVMDYNGDNQVALTDNDSNDRYPCFSPDGSKIAFCSDSDGDFEIYVMDSDGNETIIEEESVDEIEISKNELALEIMTSVGLDSIQEIKDFIVIDKFITVLSNDGGGLELKKSELNNSNFEFESLIVKNEEGGDLNILDISMDEEDLYLYSEDGFYCLKKENLNKNPVEAILIFTQDQYPIESFKNELFYFNRDNNKACIFYNNDKQELKVYIKKDEEFDTRILLNNSVLKIIEKIDNYIYIVTEDITNYSNKIYKFGIDNEKIISEGLEGLESLNSNLGNRLIKDLKYNQNNKNIYILSDDLNLVEYNLLDRKIVKIYELSESGNSDSTINHFTFNESGEFFFMDADNKLYSTYIKKEEQ